MFRIGGHVSISGGFPKAVFRELDIGGNCGQIFAGSPMGWKVKEAGKEGSKKFRELSEKKGIYPWIVHGTYLINLASPKKDLRQRSINTVQKELETSSNLNIPFYTLHPGAHTGIGENKGIKNVAESLSKLEIPKNVTLLLENTSGKGTTLGKNFEQLNKMVEESDYSYKKLGVCLDTCHLFSAGYDFTSNELLEKMAEEIDEIIGLENVEYLHLNDSKHPLGSEKDEHEHIGEGEIGEEGFKIFINYKKFRNKPMVLETPVNSKGFKWNIEKIKKLRKKL